MGLKDKGKLEKLHATLDEEKAVLTTQS